MEENRNLTEQLERLRMTSQKTNEKSDRAVEELERCKIELTILKEKLEKASSEAKRDRERANEDIHRLDFLFFPFFGNLTLISWVLELLKHFFVI